MKNKDIRCLCEGGICVALSIALSYLKIPIGLAFGGFGGSIDLVMIPLIIYAVRWGLSWGLGAGLIFGTIKYFIGTHAEISWISIIFDYSVAYMFVGFAGLMKDKKAGFPIGALIGCVCRFIVHFISGVTVYAEWMPEEFMGMKMVSPWIYSALYNGWYMLFELVATEIVAMLIYHPLKAYFCGEQLPMSAKKEA